MGTRAERRRRSLFKLILNKYQFVLFPVKHVQTKLQQRKNAHKNHSRNCLFSYVQTGTIGHRRQGDGREVKWQLRAEELLVVIRKINCKLCEDFFFY